MKVLILQDDMYPYLAYVVQTYARGGIDPDEGLALYQLNQALKSAQTVDDSQVAKIKTGEVGPVPLATVSIETPEQQ